jgi:hypothetical protein
VPKGGEGERGGGETGEAEDDDAADADRDPWAPAGDAIRMPQTSHQSVALV